MKCGMIALFVMSILTQALAGGSLTLVPSEPGPYRPGQTITVDVWLENEGTSGVDLRAVLIDALTLRDHLFIAGDFVTGGGATLNRIAKLSGDHWEAVGAGVEDTIYALTSCNLGLGSTLYAGGERYYDYNYRTAVYRLESETFWFEFAGYEPSRIETLKCMDEGGSNSLYVGGLTWGFEGLSGDGLARWDGEVWTSIADSLNGAVRDMVYFDNGTGEDLYVVGDFPGTRSPVPSVTLHNVARWSGSAWSPLDGGLIFGYDNWEANAIATFDDGAGPALYVGGDFRDVWHLVPNDVLTVNNIAKWDGNEWSTVGGGTTPGTAAPIYDMVVFDDGTGSALYIGGRFSSAGGVSANNVARWNGAAWSDVGGGVTGGPDAAVRAFQIFDDGSGAALYAAGLFDNAGGIAVSNVAKWDGSEWSAVGSGLDNGVRALASHQSIGDPKLILPSPFQFDFSTLPDEGASYFVISAMPFPLFFYDPDIGGDLLHIPGESSLRLGEMDVEVPDALGEYTVDVTNLYGPGGGSFVAVGLDPWDPDASWGPEYGNLSSTGLEIVVEPPDAPIAPAGENGYPKNRYIGVAPANAGEQTALRVTLSASTIFPNAVGRQWWVGPPAQVSENAGSATPIGGWPNFWAAKLQCTPYYTDWDSVLGAGVAAQVYGQEIVPSSEYTIEAINESSDITSQIAYSDALVTTTAKWGDVVSDCNGCPCGPPNGTVSIVDWLAVLNKFGNQNCAPIKSRCDVDPEEPDRVIGIIDVTRVQAAFGGTPYPFSEPATCP